MQSSFTLISVSGRRLVVPDNSHFKLLKMQLVLSLFSGVGLLDKGFSETGFCVVSAGDIIVGKDIRDFHTVPNKFDGIIAGSPCQAFSNARRNKKKEPENDPVLKYGLEMLGEFARIVLEAKPRWFLLENVPQVPNVVIEGYAVQRLDINALECGSIQNRNRHFQFGSYLGEYSEAWDDYERYQRVISVKRDEKPLTKSRCVTASEGSKTDRRTWGEFCELQGLPRDFDLTEFHQKAKYRAVGNGVNVHVARRIAEAIKEATENKEYKYWLYDNDNLCACGCGRILEGRQKSATPSCRKRLQKKNKTGQYKV